MSNMEIETAQSTPKPVKDRNGFVYRDQAEKMKYLMRRRRDSPLPHWPAHEKSQER